MDLEVGDGAWTERVGISTRGIRVSTSVSSMRINNISTSSIILIMTLLIYLGLNPELVPGALPYK